MTKRLQVLLDDREMVDLRKAARAEHITVAEWVRRALREARRNVPTADPGKKLAVVRAATRHAFPTADIDAMLGEIERGYHRGLP